MKLPTEDHFGCPRPAFLHSDAAWLDHVASTFPANAEYKVGENGHPYLVDTEARDFFKQYGRLPRANEL